MTWQHHAMTRQAMLITTMADGDPGCWTCRRRYFFLVPDLEDVKVVVSLNVFSTQKKFFSMEGNFSTLATMVEGEAELSLATWLVGGGGRWS